MSTIYHLVERHRASGVARITMSSNTKQSVIRHAQDNAGLIPDTDFLIGTYPEWTPSPADITSLSRFDTTPLIA